MPILMEGSGLITVPVPQGITYDVPGGIVDEARQRFMLDKIISYILVVPSGAEPTWFSTVGNNPVLSYTQRERPRTMLQPVTFGTQTGTRLRVVQLHPVDESEDIW